MDIFRFITAGSVDDGKSTLIGRILYDSQNIKDDILQSISIGLNSEDQLNLAHITDGLRSERSLGITIDVAYKYFTTANRKYIVTDAPGHFQFTKNLVTGASGVDAIIILIDAQNGITEQTRRHSLITSFLSIPNVIVVINKIDLFNYDEQRFNEIVCNYQNSVQKKLHLPDPTFIPISALIGDNILTHSAQTQWYKGNTLINLLENCTTNINRHQFSRFSVQYQSENDTNYLYAGRIISGNFSVGEYYLPEYDTNISIEKITRGFEEIEIAKTNDNIYFYTKKNIKLKRGDLITDRSNPSCKNKFLNVNICCLHEEDPLNQMTEYILRLHNFETMCSIEKIHYRVNVDTFERELASELFANEIAFVLIKTQQSITFDTLSVSPQTARGILICPDSNRTIAAFTIPD